VEREMAGSDGEALDRAARMFEETFAVAEAGRDDRQRLSAAREQVVIQNLRGQQGQAQLWTRVADALVSRLGEAPWH
jgi:hypothetical protein